MFSTFENQILKYVYIKIKFSNIKCNKDVLLFSWRSISTAEQRTTTEDFSNYQELNFSLKKNHYQSIKR